MNPCSECGSPPWAFIHRMCSCGCGDYIGHQYRPFKAVLTQLQTEKPSDNHALMRGAQMALRIGALREALQEIVTFGAGEEAREIIFIAKNALAVDDDRDKRMFHRAEEQLIAMTDDQSVEERSGDDEA